MVPQLGTKTHRFQYWLSPNFGKTADDQNIHNFWAQTLSQIQHTYVLQWAGVRQPQLGWEDGLKCGANLKI